MLAAPSGSTSAAYVRCLRASGSVECGYTWATAGDTVANRWAVLMPGSSNNLIFYTPGANNCITLLATDGSLTVHKNATFDGTVSIGGQPAATKPQYAGVFQYSGVTLEFFQSHGAIALTTSMISRVSLGNYRILLPQLVSSNTGVISTSNNGGNSIASSKIINQNEMYINGINNGGFFDVPITFMTVP